MDDKELPGFKINDYSGDGDDEADEAGGPAENSLVTHGEGDFSAVMLENEQCVGGAEEKAPKTAPEASEEHSGASEEVSEEASDEPKADSRVEASTRMTEAEARAMLIEDNARAKEALKKANSRGKKTLAIVIVIAVLLVVVGVATSIILSGMRKSDGDGAGNGDKQEGSGGNAAVVEKPEEPDGLLATNEPLVQELYGEFEISPLQGFYADELLVEASDDNREHGRLEMALNQAENWTGAAVRAKYREMFGEDVELTEEKYGVATAQDTQFVATGMRFVVYNEKTDEFHGLGPSTVVVGRHIRRLERAEKAGDRIYLYERALTLKCQLSFGTDEKGNPVDKEASCGVLTVATTCGTPEFGWSGDEEKMTDEEVLNEAKNKSMGLVRWVFGKNAEGNYVFRGLERVIEGKEGEEIVETIEEREQKMKEANA